MRVFPIFASAISLCFLSFGAGLSYGLFRARRLRAARLYALALGAFSLFVIEGLLRAIASVCGSAEQAGFLRSAAAVLVAVAGPAEVALGGRFWAAALGVSRERRWILVHDVLAALMAALSVAFLAFPGSPLPSIFARLVFFSMLIVWALSAVVLGRESSVFKGAFHRRVDLAALLGLSVVLVMLDSFAGAMLGPFDGLSVPFLSVVLGFASFSVPAGAFDQAPSLRGNDLTADFVRAAGLTVREAEVAAFAAKGSSSAEIGESLFISARTVENHLASVYRKVGVRGRVQLVRFLLSRKADSGPRDAE